MKKIENFSYFLFKFYLSNKISKKKKKKKDFWIEN